VPRQSVHSRKTARFAGLCASTALALALVATLSDGPTVAQEIGELAQRVSGQVPSETQMLMEADTLVYDIDADMVTAVGGVRIEYGGNKLVAQRVSYNRKTSRLVASGGVQIIDSSGTKVFSDEIDITDDFAEGFVNALRVETIDKTYFAAESAERQRGLLTIFNNGVYTACAPCEDKPDRAPIWRIKARKIIWNGQAQTVRFEDSRFEFFGFPIARLPAFEIADPTVKRKSGFLMPGIGFNSDLGTSVTIPYYFALSPTYDLTVTGTGYTKQGFLGEAEWRQRFDNGEYSLKMAGIYQADPGGFDDQNSVNSGPPDDPNRFRGMIGSKGRFDLNPRWQTGWNVLVPTDKNFARTYGIDGYSEYIHQSNLFLTGLNDRNFFDVQGIRFQVQENLLDSNSLSTSEYQPWVLPTLDYLYIPNESIAGGELRFDFNVRSIYRDRLDDTTFDNVYPGSQRDNVVQGVDGLSTRVTADTEWKRSFVTDGGLVVTPLLALQADTTYVDDTQASVDAINALANTPGAVAGTDILSAYYRMMATAGLEMRWPVLFASDTSSHVLEPMAQVFARPDTRYDTTYGVLNEDAQSFVFDATSLFERDKFSGYDRIEGGTRANIGFRYSGSYDNGWTTNALFGQSYHLAGDNPFAAPDLVHVGAYSGLETDTSDYVGLIGFAAPFGLSASVSGRFDEQTLEVRRTEAKTGYSNGKLSVSANYAFIQAQPLYGFSENRNEVAAGASLRFNENWRAFGGGSLDIESGVVVSDSLGLAYDDECFTMTLTMATTRDADTGGNDERTFGFNISLRTLGDIGTNSGVFAQ